MLQHIFNNDKLALHIQAKKQFSKAFFMESILEKINKREKPKEIFSTRGYMPRVYEVRSPCQWLDHCHDGKCPAFTKINGNFYCARAKQVHS
jgi:hypothetical protein